MVHNTVSRMSFNPPRSIRVTGAGSVFRVPPRATRTRRRRSLQVVNLSPLSIDLMEAFNARSNGLTAMLAVFFVGRLVIDAAEYSIRVEKKNKPNSYVSDDSDDDS